MAGRLDMHTDDDVTRERSQTRGLISLIERHVGAVTLAFCLLPYIGILAYLTLSLHDERDLAATPDGWFLVLLGILGVVLPACGLVVILRRLMRERHAFRLRALLEAYVSLILLFGSAYALVQAGSVDSSFVAMPTLWDPGTEATLAQHVGRAHDVFFNALYLSVITITTVGYGDMAPVSGWAKVLAGLEGLAGIGFVGIALGHYFSVCMHGDRG